MHQGWQNSPLLSMHTGKSCHRPFQTEFLLLDEVRLHLCEAIVRAILAAPVEIGKVLKLALVPLKSRSAQGKDEDGVLSARPL